MSMKWDILLFLHAHLIYFHKIRLPTSLVTNNIISNHTVDKTATSGIMLLKLRHILMLTAETLRKTK